MKKRIEVNSWNDFAKGFSKFQHYIPVYVKPELKDDFHRFITSCFISIGTDGWKATMVPLKLFWKFIRK